MHSTSTPLTPKGKEVDLEAAIDSSSKPEAGSSDSIYITNDTPASPIPAPVKTKTHSHHHHGHGHRHGAEMKEHDGDDEEGEGHETDPQLVVAQLIGVAILEFGIILHSIIIGLTLAVNDAFRTLFVVLIFHREFRFPSSLRPSPPSLLSSSSSKCTDETFFHSPLPLPPYLFSFNVPR